MNKIILLSILILLALTQSISATPEKQKVYSVVKTHQTLQWYEEQLALWEIEVKTNPKNNEAWLNVYIASRMIKLSGGNKTQKDLDAVVEEVKKNIPDTFEGNYIQYYNGNNDESLFKFLLKAYELNPDRAETYDDLLTHYELKRDKQKVKEFAQKWFASNDISSGLYAYNYNVLMSCTENSILFTNGDNDTYPCLILQHAKGIRTDVAVMNIYLLSKDNYRDLYFKELGIPVFKPSGTDLLLENLTAEIIEHLRKNGKRTLHFANTVDPSFYKEVEKNLYSVGLTYQYSEESFDNIAVIRKNCENKFLMDYIQSAWQNDISQAVVDHANSNYLIPFLLLYNHYGLTDEKQKKENLQQMILHIARLNDQTDEVKEIMKIE